MLNPWVILAIVCAIVGAGGGGFIEGKSYGTDRQKVADQVQFDAINKQTADNKTRADAIYRGAQAIIIQQAADRSIADNKREQERQNHAKTINDIRARYDGVGLHFTAGQTSGLGGGSISTNLQSADPTSHPAAADVQLPDAITRRIRSVGYDADALSIDYRILYAWAHDSNLCQSTNLP